MVLRVERHFGIKVHVIVEVESAVKVETQILPDRFRGDDRAPYR